MMGLIHRKPPEHFMSGLPPVPLGLAIAAFVQDFYVVPEERPGFTGQGTSAGLE